MRTSDTPWLTHFPFSAAFHQLYPWSQSTSLLTCEGIASWTLSGNTVPDTRSSRTDWACAGKQTQMLLLRYKYLGPRVSLSPALRPIQSMGKDYTLTSFGTNTKVRRLSHFPTWYTMIRVHVHGHALTLWHIPQGNNWSSRDHGAKGKGYCYSNSCVLFSVTLILWLRASS